MSREAIESFVDEIRDDLPRMRRAFAIIHAWPDDHDTLREAHRLTHSIKGTAALVGVRTLSEIAGLQEELLEQLLIGRRAMDNELRDTLEQMADIIDSYATGLLAGSVPEQQLLAGMTALSSRHATSGGVERPAPSASAMSASNASEHSDSIHADVLGQLHEMAEKLDLYRRDLTRWDLLTEVNRRLQSVRQDADVVGWEDFALLAMHAEVLLQSVLDRTVPPTESVADCLQGCVDALEHWLAETLDAAMLQQLHERIDELCHSDSATSAAEAPVASRSSQVDSPVEVARPSDKSTKHREATSSVTPPESIVIDDRSQLSEEMLEVFHEEAEDHLRQIYSAFKELEQHPGDMHAVHVVRRSAHTIKGAAGSVGLWLVSKLSHRMEDLLDVLFGSQQPLEAPTLALLYDTTDALQDLIQGTFAAEGMQVTVAQLYDSYDATLPGVEQTADVDHTNVATSLPRGRTSTIVSNSSHPFDSPPSRESEPTTLPKLVAASSAEEAAPTNELVVQSVLPMLAAWNRLSEPFTTPPVQSAEPPAQRDGSKKHGDSLRVPLVRIDSLVREVGELMINRSSFEQGMSDFGRCLEELQRAVARMRNVSRDLDVKYGVGALGGRRRLLGDGASLMPGGWRSPGKSDEEFDALELDRYTEFHLLSRSLAESTTDIGTVGQELRTLMADFDQLLNRQGRLSRDTQDRLMRIRLLPLSTLSDKLHRIVRSVATQQHKEVEFQIHGSETEIDKVVLEELADPLMHLLRNAVDHGLEDAATRQAAGKPERATIRVQAFQQGTQVMIRVTDDGRGLNYAAIRETAVRQGLITAVEAANRSEEELSTLIFLPGFSTAKEISEISGRGVGMDIVRDKVQKLKGTIHVDSQAGQGTTFTIRLPMTLAVTRAMLLHASGETFAMPTKSVAQVLRLDRHEIDALGPSPVIRLGDETLPLVYLSERLSLRQPVDKTSKTVPVLVLADGARKLAIAVDKIQPGRAIVVKSLGTHLRKVRGLIGTTLMGDGSVVPILDAADLIASATQTMSVVPAPHRPMHHDESPTIMVVDDSVSVRRVMLKLLKNAGWQTIEAKDGLDALEKLPTLERLPDLFLLDIEMPRIDGYELLKSLRSRGEFRDTPIVMVTSRAGDKHREKALRLGATDYVVKPYQDKELLSLIRRLLAAQREPALA